MAVKKDKVQVEVEINGVKAGTTFKQLKAQAKDLRRELEGLAPGTVQFLEKTEQLKKVNNVLAAIRKETRGVSQAMNEAKKELTRFSRGLLQIRTAIIGAFSGLAGYFALDKLIEFTKGLFSLGVEMEVLGRKAKTVLGEAFDQVEEKAKTNAEAIGFTVGAYIDAAAAASDLLIPMGFVRRVAADMSTTLIDLSGALAEWSGGQKKAEEVSEILSKALLGERDSLKSLGIAINDNDVKQKLIASGMEKATGKALQQAKAIATLELILAKSTDAQAAYSKNTDTSIRTQSRLNSVLGEIKETLATALLPVYQTFLQATLAIVKGTVSLILGVSAVPKFLKENKVELSFLTIALITFNGQQILASANALRLAAAQAVNTIASNAATIALGAMSIAQRGLNLAMKANPIGLLITALSLLGAGLTAGYRRSETFRASIDGLMALAKEAFSIIGESVQAFAKGFESLKNGDIKGALNQFATGIIKGNPISLVFAEGKRLKEAFNKGYKDSSTSDIIKDESLEIQEILEQSNDEKIKQTLDLSKKNQRIQTQQQKDNLELELKRLKAQQAKEKLLIENDYINKRINAGQFREKLNNSTLQYYRKQLDAFKSYGKEGITEALTIQNELDKVAQGLQNSQNQPLDSLPTQAPSELNQVETSGPGFSEDSIAAEEERKQEILRANFANAIIAEQEFNEQKLLNQANTLERRLELMRLGGEEQTIAFIKTQNDLMDVQNQYEEESLKNLKRTEDLKKDALKAGALAGVSIFDQSISLLKEDVKARKKHAKAIKAFEKAKVAVNLATEISGIWRGVNNGPLSGIPALAFAVGLAQSALALVRARNQIATIDAQEFAQGGFTGEGVGNPDRTGHKPAGIVHAGEYVVPQWQVQHPQVQPLLNDLEDMRTRGYATGGLVSVDTTPTGEFISDSSFLGQPNRSGNNGSETQRAASESNKALINRLDILIDSFNQFPKDIKASVVYEDIHRVQQEQAESETNSQL